MFIFIRIINENIISKLCLSCLSRGRPALSKWRRYGQQRHNVENGEAVDETLDDERKQKKAFLRKEGRYYIWRFDILALKRVQGFAIYNVEGSRMLGGEVLVEDAIEISE